MATNPNNDAGSWQARYGAALATCLHEPGEEPLARAHELGREALAEGRGVVALVAAHHEELTRLWVERPPEVGAAALARAGQFLDEALGAHEMIYRGFGDASLALGHMHEFVEKEAKRIAYALHDGAGQLLAAVHLKLKEVARALPLHQRAQVQEMRRLLDQVEEQLRSLAHEIHPAALDDLGLMPALEALAEAFTQRTGIAVLCQGERTRRWPAAVETALYRIVQEALNNVRKHSQARTVSVVVRGNVKVAFCTIQDDGVGFSPSAVLQRRNQGLGLVSMRERMRALGGALELRSAPGQGTVVFARVNLEE